MFPFFELAVFKRGNRDNKPQSHKEPGRETTEKLSARMASIFVSPVYWRMGHFHWIRRLTRQLKFRLSPKGHLQGTTLITMKIFSTQAGNHS